MTDGDRVLLLDDFKNLSTPTEFHNIPEVPQKRKLTDKYFLITFAVILIATVPFLIYTLIYADINRLIHGYDKCGNVCGEKNAYVEGVSCSGADMEHKPFLKFDVPSKEIINDVFAPRHCVERCPDNYITIMNRCFEVSGSEHDVPNLSFSSYWREIADSLHQASAQIVCMVAIAIGATLLLVLLFRHATKYIVWGILIGAIAGFAGLSALFWIWNGKATDKDSQSIMFLAIFSTIITCVFTLMIVCMRNRVRVIIMLFKEAMKAIFDMPLLLLEPLLTSLSLVIATILYAYITLSMTTSGFLKVVQESTYFGDVTEIDNISNSYYAYVFNTTMIFTLILNTVIYLWMVQFIVGCQHMVLAGAVSAWYFCRDKALLASPIYNSFYSLIKYHLGTVACGALIITLIDIVRAIIRGLVDNRYKILVDCCCAPLQRFLRYLTKNAYIQTAMHGQAFYKSGVRGAKLLLANVVNVVALNSVGGYVLSIAVLLIMVITVIAGALMYDEMNKHFYAAIILSAIIALVIANCVFTVFMTAIDTLFMCYCEDSIINDGTTTPYFMSTNLMQFVEESKRVVPKK